MNLVTMNKVNELRIAQLHPLLRDDVTNGIETLYAKGISLRVAQGWRSPQEQDDDYAQGRTKPGKIVTHAKAWQSFHNYGFAFDFCLKHADGSVSWSLHEDLNDDQQADWREVVDEFVGRGFEAGMFWPAPKTDSPHLQKTFGYTWQELYALHNAGEYDAEGYLLITPKPIAV